MVMVQRASDEMGTEVELRALARDVSIKASVSLYVVFTSMLAQPSFFFSVLSQCFLNSK